MKGYVLVRRFFPLSLILRPWVGEVVENLWPTDWGQKFYLVRDSRGKKYERELGYLTPISPLAALARMAK